MHSSTPPKHTNRLAQETSPYLLQHAHNPVDWYPWGPEAIERARREDRPIFLSVGYSTCYWCHVMERECFENEAIAREMNQRFINIKVDREERPDVDQLYMTAVQVLTRHGGWPMSVWLMPDLRPFYGGTYFPPTDAHGRPGFLTVMNGLEDAWKNRRHEVEKTAEQLKHILEQLAVPPAPDAPVRIDNDLVVNLVTRSTTDYDRRLGGFGRAPKFPRETLLELLLAHNQFYPHQERAAMVRRTLDAMALGGIRDQLGGGFHRYSTDAKWLVPHFEIMLYDNALLAYIYTEAYRQTEERAYAQVAREILDFTLREMTSPDGAFYTAIDAEVDAREGGSYLWTAEQVREVLSGGAFPAEQVERFLEVYGLSAGPNFEDPHHGSGSPDQNVLFIAKPAEGTTSPLDILFDEDLRAMRQALYAHRQTRKQPLLDTKIITSWNALMIRAMAYAGRRLAEPRYMDAAARAAKWITTHHVDPMGELYRTSRDGQRGGRAFLDDYAYLCQAFLTLYSAGGHEDWRDVARQWAAVMTNRFADRENGGFFFTEANALDMIVRQKVAQDSPLPAGNAVAAMVLTELGEMDDATRTLAAFAPQVEQQAEGMGSMVQAMMHYLQKGDPFEVHPRPGGSASRPLTPEQTAGGVVQLQPAWDSPTILALRLSIASPFHINAHDASAGLMATQVAVHGGAADDVDHIEYPPGQLRRLSFTEEDLRLYEGQTIIRIHFKRPPQDPNAMRIAIRYQACNENACFPAVTKEIPFPRG
jgi:uncharacterized protein